MKKNLKNQHGFTLVELLVTITIIGILSAVTVPSLLSYIDKHKQTQVTTECRSAVLTAQSMYAQAYNSGKSAPTKDAILTESGLEGIITAIEVNESITAEDDIILHLTYVDKGITVTYCKNYKTCDDPTHTELYNLADGPDNSVTLPDHSWEEEPSEPPTETETPPVDDGLYMPITDSNLKYELTGIYETYRDKQFEEFHKDYDYDAWFNLEPDSIFLVSGTAYYYVAYVPQTIYENTAEDFPVNDNNTILIDNSTVHSASTLFSLDLNGNYNATCDLTKGQIYYDDYFGTKKYYLYISYDIHTGDNINWLNLQYPSTSAWRELNLYTNTP